MDTPAYSVADTSVTQRMTGVTPPVKVGLVLGLFIYWLTKDVKLTAQIILAHMILHAIFK